MRIVRTALVVALVVAVCGSWANAADKKLAPPFVVYKDGGKVKLKSFDIGYQDEGLFGSSFKKLEKLPVRTDKLLLQIPLKNLAKIEILSVQDVARPAKRGKKPKQVVRVKLTSRDGKTLEGAVDHEKDLSWKGTIDFADAEATLDPAKVREIILSD